MEGYFLEPLSSPINPIRSNYPCDPSHPPGPGILTWFPSTTPFGLALGAGLPCPDEPWAGTLGLSARGSLTPFVATHVSILTSLRSTGPHDPASPPRERSATAHSEECTQSFGSWLEPRYIFAARQLD